MQLTRRSDRSLFRRLNVGTLAFTTARIEFLRSEAERVDYTDASVRGLQLRVETNGRKVWLHRYLWQGQRVRLTLADYGHTPPSLTLAAARALVTRHHDLLRQGIAGRLLPLCHADGCLTTQQNAALVEEATASSASILSQAIGLAELVIHSQVSTDAIAATSQTRLSLVR